MALLAAAMLAGCAFAPGGHIDYDSRVDSELHELIDIQPITPELVATYRTTMGQSRAQPISGAMRSEIEQFEYRIGPGDILTVIVYDHPELTIPAGGERSAAEAGHEVRADGSIFYPYIGRVMVAGRTLEEVRSEMARRLANYLTDPQVDVRIAAFRSQRVYISGAVNNPGAQPITSVPLTILDAISEAGGAQDGANWHEVILTRDGVDERISLYSMMREGDQSVNRLLRDGDVIHVPSAENRSVAVMGQVRTPGNIGLGNESVTLTDALSRAGGVNENTAQPSGIFVIRSQNGDSDKLATVYQLDIRDATSFMLGNYFQLEPQDVIYVTAAPLARWNRVISLLLPSVILPGSVAESASDVGDL